MDSSPLPDETAVPPLTWRSKGILLFGTLFPVQRCHQHASLRRHHRTHTIFMVGCLQAGVAYYVRMNFFLAPPLP